MSQMTLEDLEEVRKGPAFTATLDAMVVLLSASAMSQTSGMPPVFQDVILLFVAERIVRQATKNLRAPNLRTQVSNVIKSLQTMLIQVAAGDRTAVLDEKEVPQ